MTVHSLKRSNRRVRHLLLAAVLLVFYRCVNIFEDPFLPVLSRHPRVLLAVTTYNHLNFTFSTIESILMNRDHFDVMFFDDCSEDETVHFLQAHGFEVSRHASAVGPTALWNSAFMYAQQRQYDVLVLSNNDVLIPTGAVEQLVETLRTQKIGAAVPLTNARGAGFNPAQNVDDWEFWDEVKPLESSVLSAEIPENYETIQQTLLKLKSKPKRKNPKKKFGGFFFALRVDDRVCHSPGVLIDPRLRIFGQELDLGRRLFRLYGKAANIVPTAFVYHYKSVTVAKSGYKVGTWREEFDLIETYHTGIKETEATRNGVLLDVKVAFAYSANEISTQEYYGTAGQPCLTLLQDSFDIKVVHLSSEETWYELRGIDVLVVLHPAYNPTLIDTSGSSIIRIAWVQHKWDMATNAYLGYYDAFIAPASIANALSTVLHDVKCLRRCPYRASSLRHILPTRIEYSDDIRNATDLIRFLGAVYPSIGSG